MSVFYKFIMDQVSKGTNSKLEAVKMYQSDDFKELFRLMLCPSIKYNITKVPDDQVADFYEPHYTTSKDLILAVKELIAGDFQGSQLKYELTFLKDCCSDDLQEVLSWIIARKNPAKIGKTIVNYVYTDLIRTQKYMGAVSGTDKALKRLFDNCPLVNVQVKEDGMAVLVEYKDGTPVSIHTRQGVDITLYFPLFMSRLRTVGAFTGEVHHELFVDGKPRAEGNGMVNKAVKGAVGDVDNCLHSVILDLYTDGIQQDRYLDITAFENYYSECVVQNTFDNVEKAKTWAKYLIQCGGEGVICKDPKGLFKNGKPWYNVKIKNEFVVDLMCIRTKLHKTKPGQIGACLMATSDAKLEVWVNLKTDDDRRRSEWDYLRGVFRVRAESTTLSKGKKKPSLYLGRFDGDNRDEYICEKTTADTYQEVLDQEAMSKGLK